MTALDAADHELLAALAEGLALEPRPFARLGEAAGRDEAEVIARLRRLREAGVLTRLGLVVRHHELGYRANAMTVWDVPDARVAEAGRRLAALPFVTLAYRRPRALPAWPYNLFAMIHGRDRAVVEAQVDEATRAAGLEGLPRAVLFSRRCFKQCGARYAPRAAPSPEARP